MRFSVDYFLEVDDLKVHATSIPDAFRLEHPNLLKSIVRAESESIILPEIRGLKRADQFERFAP
jgi:hypothetical protein